VVDELGGPLAGALADGFEDAGLGDAAEIVADRRLPACGHHVEAGRPREPVGLCQTHVETVLADARAGIGFGRSNSALTP
jgi:hypothetical protein